MRYHSSGGPDGWTEPIKNWFLVMNNNECLPMPKEWAIEWRLKRHNRKYTDIYGNIISLRTEIYHRSHWTFYLRGNSF